MSVEQYGARLLGEVEEESLGELLRDLRNTINPTAKDVLGLPQLDRLLETFRYTHRQTHPRRPGWTSTTYIGAPTSDEEPDSTDDNDPTAQAARPRNSKHRRPIIELTSTRSASGKTTLLYHLTALALLPTSYGGKASAMLWLDSDNTFSASRLAQISSYVLSKHNLNPLRIDIIITTALQHLYILQPTSSASLLHILHTLPAHLLSETARTSHNRPLGLLVLDSATAFATQDRFDAEITRLSAQTTSPTSTTPSMTAQIISALKAIQEEFDCTLLFSTLTSTPTPRPARQKESAQRNTNPNPNAPSLAVPPESPRLSPWSSFATLTVQLDRIAVPPFAPTMSLDECLLDRSKRQDEVRKGRVAVGLRWKEAELWGIEVREAVLGMGGSGGGSKGGFVFRVGEGVDVE